MQPMKVRQVYLRGDYVTPLGKVVVNRDLSRQLLSKNKLFVERYEADAKEHSLEVEVPLLQYHLKKPFRLVPLLVGHSNRDVQEDCGRTSFILHSENVFVVSTDFSHYPSYADAVAVDQNTAKAVQSNSPDALLNALAETSARAYRVWRPACAVGRELPHCCI